MAELERLHTEMTALVLGLTDGQWTQQATIGDGDWSVRDLVGHIASWEELALERIDAFRRGQALPSPGASIDDLNAGMVASKASLSLVDLRREATETHARLLVALSELSDQEWETEVAVADRDRAPLGQALGSTLGAPRRPFGHVAAHVDDLRRYVASAARP